MADEVVTPMKTLATFTDRVTHYFRFPGLCHDDAPTVSACGLLFSIVTWYCAIIGVDG